MALKLVSNGTLDTETVRRAVIERLRPLFQKISPGYRLDRDMALNTVVYAATQGQSLHAACAALTHTVDDNTLRDALNAAFPANSVRTLEKQINGLLLADLVRSVRRRGVGTGAARERVHAGPAHQAVVARTAG